MPKACNHTEMFRNVPVGSIGPAVDAIRPRSNLKSSRLSASVSIKREKTKPLTTGIPKPCSHTDTTLNVARRPTDPAVNAAISKRNLQTSVERVKTETLTINALSQSGPFRDLKRGLKG